jgi:hypothetical protein
MQIYELGDGESILVDKQHGTAQWRTADGRTWCGAYIEERDGDAVVFRYAAFEERAFTRIIGLMKTLE